MACWWGRRITYLSIATTRHADGELQLVNIPAGRRVKARRGISPGQRRRELERVIPLIVLGHVADGVARRRLGVEAVAAAALEVRRERLVGVVDGSIDVDVQDAARVAAGALVPLVAVDGLTARLHAAGRVPEGRLLRRLARRRPRVRR